MWLISNPPQKLECFGVGFPPDSMKTSSSHQRTKKLLSKLEIIVKLLLSRYLSANISIPTIAHCVPYVVVTETLHAPSSLKAPIVSKAKARGQIIKEAKVNHRKK